MCVCGNGLDCPVVALPVVAIVGLQVFLFVAGERGTGLLPGLDRYPSIEISNAVATHRPALSATPTVAAAVESSNDEEERLAA